MKIGIKAQFDTVKGDKLYVELSLIEFKEGDNFLIYSPALDLTGYGQTEEDAKESFHVTLSEFVRYTTNKGTFEQELREHGWTIAKKKKKIIRFSMPQFEDMINKNESLKEIIAHKDFRKYTERVALSA